MAVTGAPPLGAPSVASDSQERAVARTRRCSRSRTASTPADAAGTPHASRDIRGADNLGRSGQVGREDVRLAAVDVRAAQHVGPRAQRPLSLRAQRLLWAQHDSGGPLAAVVDRRLDV